MKVALSAHSMCRCPIFRAIPLIFAVVLAMGFSPLVSVSAAERAQAVSHRPPKSAFGNLGFFKQGFNTREVLSVVDLNDSKDKNAAEKNAATADSQQQKSDQSKTDPQQSEVDKSSNPEWYNRAKLRFVETSDTEILPPEQTPDVRLNADAPDSIKALVACKRLGDRDCARSYAKQYIRYQQNFFFELREIVQLLGEAMIEQGVIDEDSWVGVGQMMDYELAKTRYQKGEVLKPTHDIAMQRIEPDPKNQVEIFYFFDLNCSWCRFMAPDVERLWQMAKADKNVKMTALTLGPITQDWVEEYRSYTGLTVPIMDGEQLAKQLGIAFVPAVVVVTPNDKRAYLKSGQQNFQRMYEFMRTAQGLPATVTPEFQQVAGTPIGQAELEHAGISGVSTGNRRLVTVSQPAVRKVEVEKF